MIKGKMKKGLVWLLTFLLIFQNSFSLLGEVFATLFSVRLAYAGFVYEDEECSPPSCIIPEGLPSGVVPYFDSSIEYCVYPPIENQGCLSPYVLSSWYKVCVAPPICTGSCRYESDTRSCVKITEESSGGSGSGGGNSVGSSSGGGGEYNLPGNFCVVDVNEDDEIQQDEIHACVTTPQGNICPVGQVDCNIQYTQPSCPDGYTYNETTQKCETSSSLTTQPLNLSGTANLNFYLCSNCSAEINHTTKLIFTPFSIYAYRYMWCSCSGIPGGWRWYTGGTISASAQIVDYQQEFSTPIGPERDIKARKYVFQGVNNVLKIFTYRGSSINSYKEIVFSDDVIITGYLATGFHYYGTHDIKFEGQGNKLVITASLYNAYRDPKCDPQCDGAGHCVRDCTVYVPVYYSGDFFLYKRTYSCPPGGIYNPNTGKCEASLTCPEGNLTDQGCVSEPSCPLGNYQCHQVGDSWKCSPYQCVTQEAVEEDEPDEVPSGYEDDGSRDESGNCLGAIYIFSGKKMRCRPSGLKTGFHNCCDEAKGRLYDSTGGTGLSLVDGIKVIYAVTNIIGQASFLNSITKIVPTVNPATGELGYLIYRSGGEVVGVFQSMPSFNVWDSTVGKLSSLGGIDSAGHILDKDKLFSAYADSYIRVNAPELISSFVSLATTFLVKDPVLSASINVVTQGILYATGLVPSPVGLMMSALSLAFALFTGGCDKQDILTSTYKESGYCHYVGKRCISKILGKCVQKAKVYCCFNSKLARIIHEQGRPQLSTFGTSGGWGSAKNPKCRGFTPEEFQAIDFGRIDFSEYVEDIQRNIRQDLELQVKQVFQESVQQR